MSKQNTPPQPSVDQVESWIRKDLESANYLIGLVLQKYPHVIKEMAENLHAHATNKPDPVGEEVNAL